MNYNNSYVKKCIQHSQCGLVVEYWPMIRESLGSIPGEGTYAQVQSPVKGMQEVVDQ